MQLSNETDFRLGGWYVRPSLGHLEAGSRVDRLEPQVMRVLIALARRAGQTVGREQLISEAWNGRVVTDDAIGRCVGHLRRVLEDKDQANVRIVTVPKIGYRLVIDDLTEPVTTDDQSPQPLWRRWLWGSAGGVVVAILLGVYLSFPETEVPTETGVVVRIRPLTRDHGLEVNPAVSPSGGTVVYSAQLEDGNWDLFLRAVGGDASVRLTDDPARDHSPAWSADGSRLMFVRFDERTSDCGLFTIAATGGAARRVADCASSGVRNIDWSADGNLIAVVENAPGFLSRGRIVDLQDDSTVHIDPPDGATLGVEDLAFSPDQRLLAYSATFGLGAEDLYVEDLETGSKTRLTFDHLKIHGLDWTPDGAGIVITSNRAGPFSLWRVSATGHGIRLLSTPFQNADDVAIADSGRLVVDEWLEKTELVWVDLETGQIESSGLSGSATFEWGAAISPDGSQIAFVSDRSGTAEIWIADVSGDNATRLTDFAGDYVQAPRWSPDGSRLAFAAPADRGIYQLFLLNPEFGELKQVTSGERHFRAPTWGPEGNKLIATAANGGENIVIALNLADGALTELGFPDTRFALLGQAGDELYLVRSNEPGLWRSRAGQSGWSTPEQIVDDLAPVDAENWLRNGDTVYYLRREYGETPRLVSRRLSDGRESVLRDVGDVLYKSGLTHHVSQSRILLSIISEQEADIYVADGIVRGK